MSNTNITVKLKRDIESKKFGFLIVKDTIVEYSNEYKAIIHPRLKTISISVKANDFEVIQR